MQKSVVELIKTRVSTRTFDSKEIEDTTRDHLNSFISETNARQEFKGRFVLLQKSQPQGGEAQKLGTYGMISGAQSFLVTVLDKKEKDALTVGFLFEKLVLFATDLGLQTCWLGGTFNKNEFEKSVVLTDQEFIPIVSPVGYMKKKPRVFDSVMRTAIGANKRKPWSELFFDIQQAPLDQQRAGEYAVPLEMVRLSPSASNKQPWRIIHDGNSFHFFLCRTPGYGITSYDMQKNDLGIAKCHFEMTASEMGLNGSWQNIHGKAAPYNWEYIASWVVEEK